MKYYLKLKRFFSFFFSLIIVSNFLISSVYASEQNKSDDSWEVVPDYSEDDLETIIKNVPSFLQFTLSEACGIVLGKDIDTVFDDIPTWFSEHKSNMRVVKNTTTGKMGIQVDKVLSDDMLNRIKEINKEPENGGYELLKTVPRSKISPLYFTTDQAYQSFNALLNDSKTGMIGLRTESGKPGFVNIDKNYYWYVYQKTDFNGKFVTRIQAIENLTSGHILFPRYSMYDVNTKCDSWSKADKQESGYLYNTRQTHAWFSLYDSFDASISRGTLNPIEGWIYIVSKDGVCIPVFNSLEDVLNYTLANNLYYTSSDYTGEGKEIIIEFDEIDNITNGYYDGMYDMLQQLIDQNGGNSLTPEQLQQLVDEVRASFGLIKDEINKGFQQQDILIQKNSSILQNIADALNAFFAETKRFRESMDKMMRDFIDGQKYTPPNQTDDNTGTGTDTGTDVDIGDGTDDGFVKKIYETVKDGFTDVVKQLKSIKRWTALDTVIDDAGVITDIISFVTDLLNPDKAADAVAEFVANGADALVGVKDLVTGKFPFCIPTDILALMQTLAHEPETPVFEIPFVLERYGIDEKVVIDLKDFQIISDISRTFLTILWCCTLMNVTTKITDMKSI